MTRNSLYLLVSVLMIICVSQTAISQDKKNFDFLLQCFKNSVVDSSDLEIDGLGEVKAIDYNSQDLEETGLTYYLVPEKKRNKSAAKLAAIATDQHVQTWKNNSRVISKAKYTVDGAAIVDLRLHMQIENIYLQVIIISDKEKMYEIMCFRDTNDAVHFDRLIKMVQEKTCFD